MKLGKKKAANQPKSGTTTAPYMPAILAGLGLKKYDEAMEILGKAACEYFARLSKVTETIPVDDATILIKLLRHMADELERADPQAAKFVKALEKIKLPPIEYQRKE